MTKKFKIGKVIFSEKNCVLIAEAGVNHNGSLKIAEKLIKEAKKNGADIIKFQTYKAEKLVVKKSPRFWNWSGEIKKKGTQYDSYSKLDGFNRKEYLQLIKLCKKYKIEFMSTPFDEDAVEAIAQEAYKRKTGARALRGIVEEIMLDLMYSLPSQTKIKSFNITKTMVDEITGGKVVPLLSNDKRVIKESA